MTAEWLEADGLGGFAMGTADGIRTRRYHALLLPAMHPPDDRRVLVADLEVHVETPTGTFALSSHQYRGDVIYPDGTSHLVAFEWRPWPRWDWSLPGGTRIAAELVVEPGTARTCLRWTRLAGAASRLHVRPLLADRDYHALQHENGAFQFAAHIDGDHVTWRPYQTVPIVASSNGTYIHEPDWYRHFTLELERTRGLDFEEDLASPGTFTFALAAAPACLALGVAAVRGNARDLVDDAFTRERARRSLDSTTPRTAALDHAAEAYIVARGNGHTVIAGYPWFADWGRDTFISLRGLCLARQRRDTARSILVEWAGAVDGGMLPNRFGEHDAAPEFNSVDAALWFVIAADAYLAGATTATDRRTLEVAIDAIVAGYTAGTRHRIGATPDGLLACGVPGLQLTWMDAKIGDDVITPRIGKPIEIQALWLNALAIAGRRTPAYRAAFERGRASFLDRFWDPVRGQLHDVVDHDHVAGAIDSTCRPNQLFAIGGLPLQLVEGDRARAVIDTCERLLWTPMGPRSLAADDPRYRGHYAGGPADRDRCYHNGPVWPWLAGAFVEAWVRVRGNTADAKRNARQRFLDPLLAGGAQRGTDHLPEICEGDAPYRACGCPFQAWSVAEALRLDRVVLV